MCTASWIVAPNRLDVLFNRDEHRTRGAALPPRVLEGRGPRLVAPTDADAGGTWIGVNEHGSGVALLNAWHARGGDAARSRGLLVRELLACDGREAAVDALRAADLDAYAGFVVLLFAAGHEPEAHGWDGERLTARSALLPTTSSGFNPEGVQRARAEVYAETTAGAPADVAVLERFHASHAPERGTLSPCMHRDEVGTVSVTHLGIRADRVFLRYAPGPLCRAAFGEPVALERRAR